MRKYGLPLAAKEKMMSYQKFRFVRFTFLYYMNGTNDVSGPEHGQRVMLAATESGKVDAARELRFEQKSSSLLRELLSRLRKPVGLVIDFFAETPPTAVTWPTVPRPRAAIGCEEGPEGFRAAKEAVVRGFGNAAFTT